MCTDSAGLHFADACAFEGAGPVPEPGSRGGGNQMKVITVTSRLRCGRGCSAPPVYMDGLLPSRLTPKWMQAQ